jgi:Do/DeqQ family serine protease
MLILAGGLVSGQFVVNTERSDGNADQGLQTLGNIQNAFRAVAAKVLPSVVEIEVVDVVTQRAPRNSPFFFFFGPRQPQEQSEPEEREFRREGLGSGVIVRHESNKVYILTNDHVVGDADEIKVNLHDGRSYDGELVGRDSRRDLALVMFESREDIPVAELGDSDEVQVGDWALAVGNPLGFESTVTAGIISAKGRRPMSGSQGGFNEYIQTDAAINQGNSGGALVNIEGKVIGINTWIASRSGGNIGLGFAIPINSAARVIDEFITKGKVEYGWLGINVGPPSDALAEDLGIDGKDGAFVYSVYRDSPAERGGLKPGDYVTVIDGEPIDNTQELLRIVGNMSPGYRASFQVVRYGRPESLTIRIAARDEDSAIESRASKLFPGLSVTPITPEIREQLDLSRGMGDLVVVNVSEGSPAGVAGFRPGDIVKSINGADVRNGREFYQAINEPKGKELVFNLYREGTRIVLGLVSE